EITEHMKRLNADIGSLNHPLQERPKVFNSVRVDSAVNVVLRMLHESVKVIASFAQRAISTVLVGIDLRSRLNVITDFALKNFLRRIADNLCANTAFPFSRFAFKQSEHSDLTGAADHTLLAPVFVHEARESANV